MLGITVRPGLGRAVPSATPKMSRREPGVLTLKIGQPPEFAVRFASPS